MRDFKILLIVIFVTAVVYYGIEPFAHSQMHPYVEPANFNFSKDDESLAKAKIKNIQNTLAESKKILENAQAKKDEEQIKQVQKSLKNLEKELQQAKENLEKYTAFWNEIYAIDFSKGDATKGAEVFMGAGCIGCHGVESQGFPAPMDTESASASFGVVPPDLGVAGYLYDEHFLAAVIKDPAMAMNLSHKFGDDRAFPMTPFFGTGGDINQELADIVAYLKSIAPKNMQNKDVYVQACQRCHDMKYDNLKSITKTDAIKSYMGSIPPDLSMMIRSRGEHYLNTFINNPQKNIPGTAMPRVGLSQKTQEQAIAYIENVGDRKKAEREELGLKIMLYFLILSVFGILWKMKVWRDLH